MITGRNAGRGRRVEAPEPPVDRIMPADVLDEDEPTRRNRDAVCANRIATALNERFGYVPLSLRYRLADEAIRAARAETEPVQRQIREFAALPDDEQVRRTVEAVQNAAPGWLDPDPPEPGWEAGERP